MGALGQFLAIMILLLMKSPTLVIAGFVPVFFDNAVIAIYADNRGGIKAAMLFPFISGLIQVFGS
ncbi:PTS transporter subunit IIC, partial [Thomasclavelia ramosa]